MRVSEVVNLDRDDVDLVGGVLTVRDSKFGKSRYLSARGVFEGNWGDPARTG